MKKLIFSSLLLSGLLVSGLSLTSAKLAVPALGTTESKTAVVVKSTVYKVDAAASNLSWNAKKVTGQHNGNVKITKGDLLVDKNKITGGTIEMDMTSISDIDNSARLVNHLKSDDFFSAEKFPVSTFKITKLTPIKRAKPGADNYVVTGDLTIKGITNPLTFNAAIDVKGNTVTAKSDAITIERLKYDIKFRSLSIFSDIGDKAIEDTFTVKFNLVARQSNSLARM